MVRIELRERLLDPLYFADAADCAAMDKRALSYDSRIFNKGAAESGWRSSASNKLVSGTLLERRAIPLNVVQARASMQHTGLMVGQTFTKILAADKHCSISLCISELVHLLWDALNLYAATDATYSTL